jgi:hypothetical protein
MIGQPHQQACRRSLLIALTHLAFDGLVMEKPAGQPPRLARLEHLTI